MSRVPRSRLHRPVDSACILTLCRPNFGRCYGHADSSGNWIDDHRRVLAESILIRHAQFFCIELVNHAISASDIRQILRPRPDIAESLTPSEVAKRWLQLCPSLRVTSVAPAPPTQAEILNITRSKARIREIRLQLSDVSWWMRLFCQRLAQHLNTHDGLDGPFHHGRFRSQKLLDDDATNTTLSQVDLARASTWYARTTHPNSTSRIGGSTRSTHAFRNDGQCGRRSGQSRRILLSATNRLTSAPPPLPSAGDSKINHPQNDRRDAPDAGRLTSHHNDHHRHSAPAKNGSSKLAGFLSPHGTRLTACHKPRCLQHIRSLGASITRGHLPFFATDHCPLQH
ncbi:MAG UNVERIFIED_CONTAM: hypothetical protein LVR18_17670 [Planctomycetaceae bacterium]